MKPIRLLLICAFFALLMSCNNNPAPQGSESVDSTANSNPYRSQDGDKERYSDSSSNDTSHSGLHR